MATQRDARPRPLQSAQCSLCGITLPLGLMVPDGGRACADIRWYCKDAQSCTERWTARLPKAGQVAPTPPDAPVDAGELHPSTVPDPVPPDPVPVDLLGGAHEEA